MYIDDKPVVVKSFDTNIEDGMTVVWASGYVDPESATLDQFARREQKRLKGLDPDTPDPRWIVRLAIAALVAYFSLAALAIKFIFFG